MKKGTTEQNYQIMPTVIHTSRKVYVCFALWLLFSLLSFWILYLAHMICVQRCVSVTAIHVAYKYWRMRRRKTKISAVVQFFVLFKPTFKNSSTLFRNVFTPLNREYLAFDTTTMSTICWMSCIQRHSFISPANTWAYRIFM